MELWIRSADKEILLKTNELEIETNMIIAFDENKYQCLGTYKSKERALEVLNEIQSILNLKNMYKYDRELVWKSWENIDEEQVKTIRQQMSVYNMPKD